MERKPGPLLTSLKPSHDTLIAIRVHQPCLYLMLRPLCIVVTELECDASDLRKLTAGLDTAPGSSVATQEIIGSP